MTTSSDTATAVIDVHGTGTVTVGGITRGIAEPGENAARTQIMATVLAHARDSRRAVVLTAQDSEGQTRVVIYPDGRAEPVAIPEPLATAVVQTGPVPAPRPPGHVPAPVVPQNVGGLPEEIEHTVYVSRPPQLQGWQLTFSTGSTATIWGSGLIGRRPAQDANEPRDHIIALDDPTRTVSRLHLEFGTTEGRLWIADRRSANGTRIVRGREVIDCTPAERYWIAPGSLIEMGDQTFTVSLSEGR
ncbi:hypothetical protein RS84_00024 [Microbacterium hydrocarbonoxydans]|uniref:FHA domain-containing protein n=1 Tax=Microbacterium hydrocarbonoxydans TaxID=273678 RepID=A0A0M2HX96_9MICO|nr:FHA domain-containing protein [Microbacterium hydrocarbonoxydans]KJL49550.1 hypothetical protein RS84_00024 [Microbacterium hydrocarbonoxydans]